jgi:hypothetical protein
MSKSKPVKKRILKKPWSVVTGILFCVLLVLTLFFLYYGISSEIDSHMLGSIGISTQTNSAGEVVLYPEPAKDAAKAGVENFDVLLRINGKLISSIVDLNEQLRGQVGEPLTIDVRKFDGSLRHYIIIRSSAYQNALDEAGLSIGSLTAIFVALSLLVGLGFAILGAYLLMRRPSDVVFILTAFVLVLLPYSLNAVRVLVQGASRANLEWLYSLLRVVGLFLASALLFIFPNGQFVPRWTSWVLVGVAVWAILDYVVMIDPYILPVSWTVIVSWLDQVWKVIIALGLAMQIYRYLRISSEKECQQVRQTGIALLVASGAYLLVWLLRNYLPPLLLSDAGWIWFIMLTEVLLDAGFLFFGFKMMLSTQKTA